MDRFAFFASAILALAGTVPGTALAQGSEAGGRYTACAGSETKLAYSLRDGDFLELSGQQGNLVIGDWVKACLFEDRVEVSGPFVATFDCDALTDPVDGGVGYDFTDAEGVPVELWFFVNATEMDPVLEFGVEREFTPDYWIDTQWPICRG